MCPLVAVKSFGKENVHEIIREIINANGGLSLDPISVPIDSYNLEAFKLEIVTKYYTAPVMLFECDDLTILPEDVKHKIEGCIFYFDSNDNNFLTEINSLVEFVNNNHIEVATLITRNLSDSSLNGISYDKVKDMCHLSFTVIDLNAKDDNDEVVGFTEVIELLKNHVWSTVNLSLQSSNEHQNLDKDDVNAEQALSEFEDLLTKFQHFKDVSHNLCREEVLQYAENLADLFANLLNED